MLSNLLRKTESYKGFKKPFDKKELEFIEDCFDELLLFKVSFEAQSLEQHRNAARAAKEQQMRLNTQQIIIDMGN